jgi:DNA segregation ATPase FtsK/SpoIIIE-like protein
MDNEPQPSTEPAKSGLHAFRREWYRQWRAFQAWFRRSLEGQAIGRLFGWFGPDAEASESEPEEAIRLELGTPRERQAPPIPALPFDELHDAFEARRLAREARRRKQRATPPAPRPETQELSLPEPEPEAEQTPPPPPVPAACGSVATLPPPPPDLGAPYPLPPLDLLGEPPPPVEHDPAEIGEQREIIQGTIDSFGIDAEVGHATRGPRVTLFEVNVAQGVKVEAVARIANNLAMDLAAVSLRILAPMPGQDYVGIEVPNRRTPARRALATHPRHSPSAHRPRHPGFRRDPRLGQSPPPFGRGCHRQR